MLPIIATTLVVLGLLILISNYSPVQKLIYQLPSGQIRQKWFFQATLIGLFVLGYLAYAILFCTRAANLSDLIVPGVFFFGAAFVRLTTTLSLQTAIDIQRVTLLEQENITDPLIGIYNRRCMDRRLHEEFQRAKRYQLPLSLLLIDIDYFKQINDTHGHQAGDMVLRNWGHLILSVMRQSDIAVRYGGDEILIIAPNTAATVALVLAERIHKKIESHEIIFSSASNKQQIIQITVSIGIAELTPAIENVENFLACTDRALYYAKSAGRNTIFIQNECASEAQK